MTRRSGKRSGKNSAVSDEEDFDSPSVSADEESATAANKNQYFSANGDNDNDQKSHYFITPNRKRKAETSQDEFPSIVDSLLGNSNCKKTKTKPNHRTPFLALFNGKESDQHVQKRYQIYKEVWQSQLQKIESELNNTNQELFTNLSEFVFRYAPVEKSHIHQLPVGFVQLSSNSANNLRIMEKFNIHLNETPEIKNTKVININSKNCYNIKAALREIIKQFIEERSSIADITTEEQSGDEEEDLEEEGGEGDDENDIEENNANSDGEDDQGEENQGIEFQGRVNYDFDIVGDWWTANAKLSKLTQAVIILQDANSVSNHVLNQLVRLLHAYSAEIPLRLILGLSSENTSTWINNNLNNESRTLIDGYKFKSNDNVDLGFVLLDKLFLCNNNPSILLDPKLTTIMLNRFYNSNNSIDALIAEIKLIYMIYFYQQPLSILLTEEIPDDAVYIEALRKLPSFKRHIEMKVYEKEDSEVRKLLTDDNPIKNLFKTTRTEFKLYQLTILNVITVVNELQRIIPDTSFRKKTFDLYNLVTSNKLVNSVFLNEIFKGINKFLSRGDIEKLIIELDRQTTEIYEDAQDEQLAELKASLLKSKNAADLSSSLNSVLQNYFKNNLLHNSIDNMLFHEIFTMNGGTITQTPPPLFEENYENLMINLVRPNLRSTLEQGLDDCTAYLHNPLVRDNDSTKKPMHPTLTQLFKVYKEAPVNINIYDFYVAFKQSLDREQVKTIIKASDKYDLDKEEHWEKLTYAWFIQNCFELMTVGLLKEKPKGDYLEKAIWKGV
ncbi:origin recognition complex subunit 3 N-terminus-domain-containing protein [Scheffersomyces xylosifermentans]|uniref:origin recognition complex subunit 3 N-terminus-domain-containing protein n=1 Tax=Scheffersomyces xylosifermentans TaxID=1304137 RepID=UPI00315CC508